MYSGMVYKTGDCKGKPIYNRLILQNKGGKALCASEKSGNSSRLRNNQPLGIII
jgi:hypothetical protein